MPEAQFRTEPIDRAATPRPVTGGPAPDGVYRIRRQTMAVTFVLFTAVFEVPALRLLLDAAVLGPVSRMGVLSGTFLAIGLPIFATGMYGLTSAGAGLPGAGWAWARPPLAYVLVGLALFLAAALAAA